ncbi:MAG: phosphoribosyl-ATP diphosphatase, partial [Anaerolineales bacterium]
MLDKLFNIIEDRKKENSPSSYTCALLNAGEDKILRKINEESFEVIMASKSESDQRLIEESADLSLWPPLLERRSYPGSLCCRSGGGGDKNHPPKGNEQ